MKDLSSSPAEVFSAFLTEKENDLRDQVNQFLISYAVESGKDLPLNPLKIAGNFDVSLHYEKPDENFAFTALGMCIDVTENGSGRFAASIKKIKEWQGRLITNVNRYDDSSQPLFVGGVKFAVEHSDEIWKDFSDSTWFVPEYLFLTSGDEKKIIFNFTAQPGSSIAGLTKKFESKLHSLLQLKVPAKQSTGGVKLLSVSGDTPKDKKKWKQMIEGALENIEHGDIDKVVLSRKVDFLFSDEPDVLTFHEKLKAKYDNCYNFLFRKNSSSFFGATPERLARFNNGEVLLEALAGSAAVGENGNIELFSGKNLNEHNFVVEHLKTNSRELVENITHPEEPVVKELPNIKHLATELRGSLNENSSMLSLIEKIFPTPAICGVPSDKALQFIKKCEIHQRGLYSGLIGWFNFFDEGEFVIAIRSAILCGKRLYAYAGCGIVAGSDPASEYNETELKLKPILSLFRQENENK